MKNISILSLLLACGLSLSSCSNLKIDPTYGENPDVARKRRAGRFFGDDVMVYGAKKSASKEQEVKAQNSKGPLWVASIEVIGDLFPIAIIDNDSGIIVTEWHQESENDAKRVKINAVVKPGEIKPENLSISVFTQVKDKKGEWMDKKTDNELVIKLIKDKIIAKAIQLSDLNKK